MRENQPLVSIIMPVYNGERFLESALESIVLQEYQNWELLVIDDNSTDGSGAIIKKYAGKEDRILFLQNETDVHGPGPARNIGLDHAKGECIYFMDSDDWADKSLLQCAVSRMRETGADIVQFGAIYESEDESCSEPYGVLKKGVLTKEMIKGDFIDFWKNMDSCLWMCLFRRKTVDSIRFENIMYGEDSSYLMDVLCHADKIAYIEKALYHYRQVHGSTSRRWRDNMVDCFVTNWSHQRKYLDSFQGGIDILAYAESAYGNIIWAIYQLCNTSCPMSYREKRRELARLEKEMDFDKYRKRYPLEMKHGLDRVKYTLVKYHLEGMILLLGPIFLVLRGE